MPDDAVTLAPEKKSWPPRQGVHFFLLWCAGLIASVFLLHVVARLTRELIGVALVVMLGRAWQGWLIFPQRSRIVIWALISLLGWTGVFYFFPYMGYAVVGIVEVVLLCGVRRRAWLWLLVAGAQTAMNPWLWPAFTEHQTYIVEVVLGIVPFVPASMIAESVEQGLTLCDMLIGGAILAWWMPPLARSKRRDESANTAPSDD